MGKVFKTLSLIAASLLLFSGCGFFPGYSPSGTPRNIYLVRIYSSVEDEDVPLTKPGDSIELTANAYDSRGNKVQFSPVWNADVGSLDPEEGETVVYNVPHDAETGLVFVTATIGELSDTIIIEIQR